MYGDSIGELHEFAGVVPCPVTRAASHARLPTIADLVDARGWDHHFWRRAHNFRVLFDGGHYFSAVKSFWRDILIDRVERRLLQPDWMRDPRWLAEL